MMIEIMMRPSILVKLMGAVVCAGLSIYNLVSSSDQVLIRSANSSSSRTEVKVFESPSRQLNLTSGVAFGVMFCGLVYFSLSEYNSVVEGMGDAECVTQEEDHPHHQYQSQQIVAPSYQQPQPQPQLQQPHSQTSYAVEPPVPPSQLNVGSRSHLRLVPPITADGTAPYLIPPNEFMDDMEAEDYWADKTPD